MNDVTSELICPKCRGAMPTCERNGIVIGRGEKRSQGRGFFGDPFD